MSETDQEQLEYGNVTCVHGMNLGTSGGADFMCGECESGFTNAVVCLVCDSHMWLQHGMWVTDCYPSTKRADEATFLREHIRLIRESDLGMTQSTRRIIMDVIVRVKGMYPKRDHNYNREAQL